MNEKNMDSLIHCLNAIYCLNKEIKLMSSIGIIIEGNISENDIGGCVYESISEIYSIIENILNEAGISSIDWEILDYLDSSTDNQENTVNKVINDIMSKLARIIQF